MPLLRFKVELSLPVFNVTWLKMWTNWRIFMFELIQTQSVLVVILQDVAFWNACAKFGVVQKKSIHPIRWSSFISTQLLRWWRFCLLPRSLVRRGCSCCWRKIHAFSISRQDIWLPRWGFMLSSGVYCRFIIILVGSILLHFECLTSQWKVVHLNSRQPPLGEISSCYGTCNGQEKQNQNLHITQGLQADNCSKLSDALSDEGSIACCKNMHLIGQSLCKWMKEWVSEGVSQWANLRPPLGVYTQLVTHTHTLPTWHCHMQLFHTQLVTHTLATQHCHTHTTLSHSTLSHTHNSFTHNLSYTHTLPTFANTTLSHTHPQLFHIQHCHTHTRATLPHNIVMHNSSTHNSFTHNLSYTALSHTTLSRTTLSHTIAFVWQAWPLVTLMFLLLGHRGAFVWQAWHLVRLMALLCGRCGTSYFFSGTIFQCFWIQNQNRNPNFV